jgi:NCAIR mutase (PurE)-related protein
MDQRELRELIKGIKDGKVSEEEAVLKLKVDPFKNIGFAKLDMHRGIRTGNTEVIYGAGKTTEQIEKIIDAMMEESEKRVLVTRLSIEKAESLKDYFKDRIDFKYNEEGKIGLAGKEPEADGIGTILVISAGTSDIPVCEEAAFTAEFLGNNVVRLYDVGVAGLERLIANLETIMSASVIIAVAGMEGALPTVINGLVDCPVIAVPTSVGYGTSFGGISALLTMLNSCSSGMSVQNIDNGFGAACFASRINHMKKRG